MFYTRPSKVQLLMFFSFLCADWEATSLSCDPQLSFVTLEWPLGATLLKEVAK